MAAHEASEEADGATALHTMGHGRGRRQAVRQSGRKMGLNVARIRRHSRRLATNADHETGVARWRRHDGDVERRAPQILSGRLGQPSSRDPGGRMPRHVCQRVAQRAGPGDSQLAVTVKGIGGRVGCAHAAKHEQVRCAALRRAGRPSRELYQRLRPGDPHSSGHPGAAFNQARRRRIARPPMIARPRPNSASSEGSGTCVKVASPMNTFGPQ